MCQSKMPSVPDTAEGSEWIFLRHIISDGLDEEISQPVTVKHAGSFSNLQPIPPIPWLARTVTQRKVLLESGPPSPA